MFSALATLCEWIPSLKWFPVHGGVSRSVYCTGQLTMSSRLEKLPRGLGPISSTLVLSKFQCEGNLILLSFKFLMCIFLQVGYFTHGCPATVLGEGVYFINPLSLSFRLWSFVSALSRMPKTWLMMTSSDGNIFRVTGHLCGEFTGHRWITRTKASDEELWCFHWSAFQ